jgi:hypothetical protein
MSAIAQPDAEVALLRATAIAAAGIESKLPTVVGPMKKGLSLAFAAGLVSRFAVKLDLSDVPSHCLPPPDLSKVFLRRSAANIISAVPLKPAARIVRVYPSVLAPNRQRLAGIDAEVVERGIEAISGKFCVFEPRLGEFFSCVGQVLAAEHAQSEHLFGS